MYLSPIVRVLKNTLSSSLYLRLRRVYYAMIIPPQRNFAFWKLRHEKINPQSYSEKVRYKGAFERDPILTMLADKIAVRRYVKEKVGAKYLTTAYETNYDVDTINWAKLPREYVCKANHGCGGIIMIRDAADPTFQLPTDTSDLGWATLQVHPDQADPERIAAICKYFLMLDFSWQKGSSMPEWAYRNIRPGILIEELLEDEEGNLPIDYKFIICNGGTQLIWALSGRNGSGLSTTAFDRDWNHIDIEFTTAGETLPVTQPPLKPPSQALELRTIAETLSQATDSLRVDLYAVQGRIKFGEVTVYPSGGDYNFSPKSFNDTFAQSWVPNYK